MFRLLNSHWPERPPEGLPERILLLLLVGLVGLPTFFLSRWIRQQLLQRQWQNAAQKILAALTQTVQDPEQAIAQALAELKTQTGADAAIVLHLLDAVTAEAWICLPEAALPHRLTTPALFAEAIAQDHCLYYSDYPATAHPAPALLAQGVKSMVVMPLRDRPQGAILLLWHQHVTFSRPMQEFIEALQSGLGHLLQLQTTTLRLERTQARLVAMLETIPQGVIFVQENGEPGWINPTAAAQLGLPQGAVTPHAIAEAMTALRMSATNVEQLTAQAAQFFAQPQVVIRDWQWNFANRALSLSSTPIDLPQAPGRLWLLDDVSDRQRSQEELQQQIRKAQLFSEVTLKIRQSLQIQDILQATVAEVRKILNTDRVLIYRLWPNGTGSSVAEEMSSDLPTVLGYVFPEEVFPEESRQLYRQGRIGLIPDVEHDPTIAPCLVGYLQQFAVKAKLAVPIFAKAELWGLLVAHQCDVPRQWTTAETELLKQLADQIGIALTQAQLLEQETRQRQELSRSNTELQQFAYIASHDLQEPLRMVTSYLQLLERRYKHQLDADADDFIGFAVDGANRMKALIEDLLAYSRVGTHGRVFERVDCTTVVARSLANLKIAIEESQATVTYGALPEVMGDSSQLVQLFQNLISNAIKFRNQSPPVIHIAAEPREQTWLFSVQDNGIGIESAYAERIFVIFQRLHKRTEYPGTGIGLAVCKKIVERHGGQIWMQSEMGQGSTFYFTLLTPGDQ